MKLQTLGAAALLLGMLSVSLPGCQTAVDAGADTQTQGMTDAPTQIQTEPAPITETEAVTEPVTEAVTEPITETEIITEGTLEATAEGFELRYVETDATGYDGANTLLKISENKFELLRTGSVEGELIIELNKKNFCHYGTPYGELIVGVQAKYVRNNLSLFGGKAEAGYVMDMNSVLVGNYELTVEVKTR